MYKTYHFSFKFTCIKQQLLLYSQVLLFLQVSYKSFWWVHFHFLSIDTCLWHFCVLWFSSITKTFLKMTVLVFVEFNFWVPPFQVLLKGFGITRFHCNPSKPVEAVCSTVFWILTNQMRLWWLLNTPIQTLFVGVWIIYMLKDSDKHQLHLCQPLQICNMLAIQTARQGKTFYQSIWNMTKHTHTISFKFTDENWHGCTVCIYPEDHFTTKQGMCFPMTWINKATQFSFKSTWKYTTWLRNFNLNLQVNLTIYITWISFSLTWHYGTGQYELALNLT